MKAQQKRLRKPASKPQRKRIKFSKIVVVCLLCAVLIFTIVMILLYLRTGAVPDALIAPFFAFAGGEAGVMGVIKYGDSKYSDGSDSGDEEGGEASG